MGTIERREREKLQRREDIVDAAEKVIFSKGYEVATMDDVAKEAELSKGTLYLYFKSKEELYFAIVLRAFKIMHQMMAEESGKYETGLQKVRATGDTYVRFGKEYPDYFNALMYYESLEINFEKLQNEYDFQEDITVSAFHQSDKTTEELASAIQLGIDDGSIRSDLDPHKTAIFLWGSTTGMLQLLKLKGHCITKFHNNDPDEYMDYYIDFMGNCLLPK